MPIPDYQTLMLPLLRFYADGAVHSLNDAIDVLAREFKLTEEDLRVLLPSGRQSTFRNRVAWARTYISKAGLLASVKRGHFSITESGRQILADNPARIDTRFLRQFPSFVQFQETKHEADSSVTVSLPISETKESPEEQIESAHTQLKRALASDLLTRIQAAAPVYQLQPPRPV